MRLVLILLTVMLFRVSATESLAQETRINLKMENSTVKEVLKNIESRSDFTFYYNDNVIDRFGECREHQYIRYTGYNPTGL